MTKAHANHTTLPESPAEWDAQQSSRLYGVRDWGAEYFDITDEGNAVVSLKFGDKTIQVPLIDIVQGMKDRGLDMPAVLRIENLLDIRITQINEAFHRAIEQAGYQNHYRGVFPIKVNQQCHVIEEIADYGRRYHHGLEAGSKAELIIAISQLRDHDSLIICNGYKDEEFIELGLYARQMGIKCFFVLETATELSTILERSKALGIDPLIGMRIRLASTVEGHWNGDSGDRSIFGLSTHALLEVVEQLKQADMLHCLQLLHSHLGSQIPNIRNIRSGVMEACRFYSGLIEEGAPMGYIDLGGGLAVDYEGTRSNSTHSMNYGLDEYCYNIVETLQECLDPLEIPHPVIVSESGRALVAYSSMLLFNVLEVRDHKPGHIPASAPEDSHDMIINLYSVRDHITVDNLQECYNDSLYYRDEIRELFHHGQASLRDRALAENLALAIWEKISELLPQARRISAELESLPELLSDIYYGNFSLFQSLPDIWAIDQLFPIMPIHRLDEAPTRSAVLADMTCDCDGKIDAFSYDDGYHKTLPLHPLKSGEEYYLSVFLVGAYQETLGDLHNLFGDTNVVSVHINEDGSFDFIREFHGDSIADVLSYVEYDPKVMQEQFRRLAESAVREGRISVPMRQQMLRAFNDSLNGYTFFER
ncbi:Biosynthetic arginine decarboxylase [Methylophaga frappieri]|uniref:Arginine decarboxylase n=1 Tax=Methylophaga frappieri (strain ATCC BAA-2434 / DSM 25690 / JAM7) TaxID=754477 RepID=I1YEJ7_METFJ|nr:biosynthetic arginine decarboxylase [Methylophaga frappieri]AFJ01340.1 Biosynthetic arginine decarboxylase [Methylophaga frappieri]